MIGILLLETHIHKKSFVRVGHLATKGPQAVAWQHPGVERPNQHAASQDQCLLLVVDRIYGRAFPLTHDIMYNNINKILSITIRCYFRNLLFFKFT